MVLFGCLLAAGSTMGAPAGQDDQEADMPTEMDGFSTGDLRRLSGLVQRTGLGRDSIPALSRPDFLTISDADLSMESDEVVFVVHYPNNLVRIYPQRIMVWHEIINDVVPDEEGRLTETPVPGLEDTASGESYTITYSPLTGSVVGFRSMASRYPSSFGLSGNLLNGNSVLYDRISHSLWSQLLALCIEGPLRGKRLDRILVVQARWKGTKERYGGLHTDFHGTAEVLSRSTGYRRSYGRDPYGSYQTPGNYYDNNVIPFPVSFLDSRLPPKKRILGIEVEDAYGAIQKDAVRKDGLLNFTLGVTPMVALHDSEMDSVRVFNATLRDTDRNLTFILFEGKVYDEQTRSEWLPSSGRCIYGPLRDTQLNPVIAVDSMWFAWASLYRGTRIFPYSQWQ